MELLNKTENKVIEVIYIIQDETSAFLYKEWRKENGKVIDSILQDKDGNQIDSPSLIEQVENYLQSIGE